MFRRLFAFVSLCFLTCSTFASPPAGTRTQVFNGQNLHGWQITGCEAGVENGSLVLKDGNGLLRTDSRYRDFVLELNYKPRQAEKYDSGIYLRAELPAEGKPWPSQYQINLKQVDELNLNGFSKARSSGLVKPGQWNQIKLTVVGDKATMVINGKPAWETGGIEARDGYIGLQAEVPGGGQFEFKDIFITELGYKPLFDGQSLAGWEGAGEDAAKCWKVADGAIVCTGEKGPWLRTAQDYDDFNLRLEYKLKPGGNSGVYVRVPADGDHHGDGAGVEIQVLDDGADRYRKLKPYQYTGSVYAIVPAREHVAREAGQWNSLEINCRGTAYHIIHNGVLILEADGTTHPELKGRLTKGFLGLQNHSEEVWFRNLRIGPAVELPVSPEAAPPTAATIKPLLERKILDDGTPQKEVEAFCEARVIRLPAADAAERKSTEGWTKYMGELRQRTLDNVVFRGEAAAWRDADCKVEWLDTINGGEGYKIKKLRYEAVPGLWIPALLYEPTKLDGKVPVFLNVNGHDGKGKAAPYKQIRSINMAKRGMIVLNVEWLGMGQLRSPGNTHYRLNQIDLCGTSGIAPFFLSMKRGLDILLAHPNADASRVGVSGLSGGGWQTIFISSLDPRVTLANPVAGYSSYLTRIHNHTDLGDSEQTPCDLAATADYAHLTAMLAPRVALLTYNEKDDCCFAAPHALPPLLEAARPVYQLFDRAAALHEHINYDPGTHNFERDNREALYKVIGQHWYSDDGSFSATEIECASEVKTAEQLAVDLPADNLDLQKLAERLMQNLPKSSLPTSGDLAAWQTERRKALAQVLRIAEHSPQSLDYTITAEQVGSEKTGAVQATFWKLRAGPAWTIPAVELASGDPQRTVVVIADEGRAAAAEQIVKLLNDGNRVVAVDPFYFGESKIKSRDFLFGLLVSSVGERPLGVQASQLAAVSRWLAHERNLSGVELGAFSPRTSLIALTAAAIEEQAISGVQLHGSHGSLKQIIEAGSSADKMPEQFCFGLLETTDIPQLAALVAPREVRFAEPSDRVKSELASLKSWYKQLGKDFDPLAP